MNNQVAFDVYGQIRVRAERSSSWWDVYEIGADGKRRRLDDVVVESSAPIENVQRALEAIYHEIAMPGSRIVIAEN